MSKLGSLSLGSLSKAGLLTGLTPDQLKLFADLGQDRAVKAGEAIFTLGAESNSLFVVCSGRVELTFPLLVMGQTKEVCFQSLEAGQAFAWSALVPPHRLTMSARAATDCELAVFDRKDLLALFKKDPSIGMVVMTGLAAVVGGRLLETQALWVREVQRNVSQTYR